MRWLSVLLLILLTALPVYAQNGATEVKIIVENKGLFGTYYDNGGDAPAVLLLHELYTNRSSWDALVQPLLDAGFKVLAVDLRGYGKTRGKINWTTAQADTVGWTDWLKAQSGVTGVMMVGSSMGANLALVGCLAVDGCKGAVALSPSLNYFGVHTEDALSAAFPMMIIYADHDPYPAADMEAMQALAADRLTLLTYTGRAHGMLLFDQDATLPSQIVTWLQAR